MRNAAEGRVALVTGASQGGTGTVAAIRLAAEGAKVAITARSVDGLERTRAEIETLGGTALVLPCDLTARDGGRDTLVARTEADLGPVDILVNNAAAGGYRPLEDWAQDRPRPDHGAQSLCAVAAHAPGAARDARTRAGLDREPHLVRR